MRALAQFDPCGKERRILQPGADPEQHLLFLNSARLFQARVPGVPIGVLPGRNHNGAHLTAAGVVGVLILCGKSGQGSLEVVEAILADAFDQGGKRQSRFDQRLAEGLGRDVWQRGREFESERLFNAWRISALQPGQSFCFFRTLCAPHGGKWRRRPRGRRTIR